MTRGRGAHVQGVWEATEGPLGTVPMTAPAPHLHFPSGDPVLLPGCHSLLFSVLELFGRGRRGEVGRDFFHMSPQNYSSQTIQ